MSSPTTTSTETYYDPHFVKLLIGTQEMDPKYAERMRGTLPPSWEETCLKLEAKLAERNRYIEELENRLRSLWDKYYADSNHHMERIKRLEEAGNDLDSWLDRETPVTIRTNWRQAKEAKP